MAEDAGRWVDVAVLHGGPTARPLYTYHLPRDLEVRIGELVWVPFGPGRRAGVVVGLREAPPAGIETRPVEGTLGLALTPTQVALSRWLAAETAAPLEACLRLCLPPGLLPPPGRILRLTEAGRAADGQGLPPGAVELLTYLQEQEEDEVPEKEAAQALGLRSLEGRLRPLLAAGLVERARAGRLREVGPPRRIFWEGDPPSHPPEGVRLGPLQRRALRLLEEAGGRLEDRGLDPKLRAALARLAERGWVRRVEVAALPDPLGGDEPPPAPPPYLTPEQARAWRALAAALDARAGKGFLLQGVTGSGKTELYLRALGRALRLGRQVLILVPEIALTPQTVRRFWERFPGRIQLWHSGLSQGTRQALWHAVARGEVEVVVGARSALFLPFRDLGLIVLDEEHETSYKQERTPRYHARSVALWLGRRTGAPVILGSATPSLESLHAARQGRLTLLRLPYRVAPGPTPLSPPRRLPLPPVRLVDMRGELRAGHVSLLSRPLLAALRETLQAGGIALLFLNRRGHFTFYLCPDCGQALRCRRCDVALTRHGDRLLCHLCGRAAPLPVRCPTCGSPRIKGFGAGTERVEAEVRRRFPEARILRWDRDTTRTRGAHERLYRALTAGEVDVLVGTQMIAKGLDLPRVRLVGVISADVTLNLPDIRAAERTFQLLVQVVGRAGRRGEGRAVVQTYHPEHWAIQTALRQDVDAFLERELAFRRRRGYPPFRRLVRFLILDRRLSRARERAREMEGRIREVLPQGASLFPAVPPPLSRVRGRYRFHVVVALPEPRALLGRLSIPPWCQVDVDPVSLL